MTSPGYTLVPSEPQLLHSSCSDPAAVSLGMSSPLIISPHVHVLTTISDSGERPLNNILADKPNCCEMQLAKKIRSEACRRGTARCFLPARRRAEARQTVSRVREAAGTKLFGSARWCRRLRGAPNKKAAATRATWVTGGTRPAARLPRIMPVSANRACFDVHRAFPSAAFDRGGARPPGLLRQLIGLDYPAAHGTGEGGRKCGHPTVRTGSGPNVERAAALLLGREQSPSPIPDLSCSWSQRWHTLSWIPTGENGRDRSSLVYRFSNMVLVDGEFPST
jgi:hypothetical protein